MLKLGKNKKRILMLLVSKVYCMIIGMISSVLMVRYFQPQLNGEYNYVTAYVTIFSGIALMGLDNVLIKEFSKKNRMEGDIFKSSFGVRCIGTIISIILLVGSFVLKPVDRNLVCLIFIAALPFVFNIVSGVNGWLMAKGMALHIAIAQAIAHTLCIIGRIVLVQIKGNLWMFIFVSAAESFFLILIEWIFYFICSEHFLQGHIKFDTMKYFVQQGLPIILGSIANTVFMKIDQVMIGDMIGKYDLGIYSVAVRIAELWYFIPTTIVSALIPGLTIDKQNNSKEFDLKLQRYMSLLVLLGYVTGIIIVFLAKPVVYVLYGREYLAAVPILCVYIWAGIFINMSVLRGAYFVIVEHTKYSFWCNFIGAVINVILNYMLIPIMGCMGAAIATLLSYLSYAYISSLLIKDLRVIGRIQSKAFLLEGLVNKWVRK